MDRLEAMSIVLAVAEAGSLSAAARRLNTPAATASRKITELEAHLRCKLFDRTAQRLTLTVTGSAYVAASKRILGDLSEAERAASGEYTAPTGELILTAPVAFGRIYLMPVVAEFLKLHPEIDIRLLLDEQVFNLVEHQIDLALRVGVLPDSRLIALPLGTIRGQVMVASPAYLAVHGTPRVPEDLATHDCIIDVGIPTPTPTLWPFLREDEEFRVAVHARLYAPSVETACDAARAGIGIARALYPHVSASVDAGTLVTVLDDFQTMTLPVSFVYAAGRYLPIKVRAFLDFAAPRLKPLLARGGSVRPA